MRSYTPLSSATIDYRAAKARVREAQRQELKDRIQDELVALGREITFLTSEGATIQEIEQAMGSKSRTLIYDAKRAYAASNQPEQPEQPKPSEPQPETAEYTLEYQEYYGVVAIKWVNNVEEFLHVLDSGELMPPIEWSALDKTRQERKLYARIIAEAEALVAE